MTVDSTLRALDVPRLVVLLPDGKEVHHHIAGEEVTIGRDPSNRICLSDNFVSKFHAKLLVTPRTITLVDLGSANKTYVNGEPITQKPLRFGDAIRFASVECRLEGPEAAAKPAPAGPSPERAPAPPAPAPPAARPVPPVAASPPSPKPHPAAPPKAAARPGPPRVEADPMKRLLVIGGLLILVSLVLGVGLRVLLVPSDAPETATGETRPDAATPAAPPQTTAPPAASQTSSPDPANPRPGVTVDASGNRSAEFYFEEGLSYLDTGRLKEAQASFRKVLDLDPDHSRARTRLSLLDEEIEAKAKRHFDAAREAFQFLRYDEAIAEWEMFLLLADPGDVRYAEAQGGIEQAKAKLR